MKFLESIEHILKNPGLFYFFRLFHITQLNKFDVRVDGVLGTRKPNPGRQFGRHRRIHWAMAAPLIEHF